MHCPESRQACSLDSQEAFLDLFLLKKYIEPFRDEILRTARQKADKRMHAIGNGNGSGNGKCACSDITTRDIDDSVQDLFKDGQRLLDCIGESASAVQLECRAWLMEHYEELLQQYENRFVAISTRTTEKIVATGNTYEEALIAALNSNSVTDATYQTGMTPEQLVHVALVKAIPEHASEKEEEKAA